jgi:hypothetical protein
MHRLPALGASVLVFAALTACQDTLVRALGPENNVQEHVETDSLRFQATGLDNVHDEMVWTWTNTGTAAVVLHRSFVHHGHGQIVILDAQGTLVYEVATLENELDNETQEGVSGDWTVVLRLFGAKGRVDISVVAKR